MLQLALVILAISAAPLANANFPAVALSSEDRVLEAFHQYRLFRDGTMAEPAIFDGPAETALTQLAAQLGQPIHDPTLAAITDLAQTHKELYEDLSNLISAYSSMSELSQRALLDTRAVEDFLAARLTFIHTIQHFQMTASRTGPVPLTTSWPGVLALDLVGVDSVYTTDYHLSVDVGGNDTYLNNAGGSTVLLEGELPLQCLHLTSPGSAAALIDLSGNDSYSGRTCGGVGGATKGSGFLYDASGDDTYTAGGDGSIGGVQEIGFGFLLDLGGDDSYVDTLALSGTNGGVAGIGGLAIGALFDLGGNDNYTAAIASNGGAFGSGEGLLFDASGNDTYRGSRGSSGGADGGSGLLIDLEGDDAYRSRSVFAVFGGAENGNNPAAGLLLDLGGRDLVVEGEGTPFQQTRWDTTIVPKGSGPGALIDSSKPTP